MLRTTLVYALGISLALGILIVSLFAVTFKAGRVRGAITVAITSPTVSPTPINYILPYPGILPDSPLWVFKALRDRLILLLAWDSVSKVEKELLLADKRLKAAEALIEGGKMSLGVSTAIKGEKYLLDAVTLWDKTGNHKPDRQDQLERALAKHKEILIVLKEKSPELNNLLKEASEINQGATELLKINSKI
ncbi:MAG: Fibronectin type III domain-containing protein [Microgenomates group bacterium GW2011_GWA2_44_7]|nr:MAG: Fibronectin type III domain-containing protein [Microgenomates group bacterium GW2011_GWA2_44_7]KKT78149.1 MAG: Fibronectin type III domain-containing protein [Microgenomates group bacterium GW2011_GWB1_44_8]